MFKHPSYYRKLKEFGKRGDRGKPTAASPDMDQAISCAIGRRPSSGRAPGPGLKQQAPSDKLQAPSESNNKPQASSPKHKGSSAKPQASSAKIPEPGKSFTDL